MKKFYVISNISKDPDLALAQSVCNYLMQRDCEASYQEFDGSKENESESYNYADPGRVPEGTECVIVLGGDGTLIQAARDLSPLNIPAFGVNIGTIGYLTEVDMTQLYPALDIILSGTYEIDERMMLQGSVIREGREVYSGIALNDIVLNRVGQLRVIHFDIHVNGEFLITYPADGLIVSTPTGSTAYNLSAGGPIVQPRSNMILTTPICAHVLNKSSVIFEGSDVLEIVMNSSPSHVEERAVTFDGADSFMLQAEDRVVIRKSSQTAKFLHTKKHNFLQILRNKLS